MLFRDFSNVPVDQNQVSFVKGLGALGIGGVRSGSGVGLLMGGTSAILRGLK